MRIPGLVSVTFRGKSPEEICRMCERAHLRAIEWGGDVHVPPKGRRAGEVRRMSEDHGLTVCSYGSYFRLGQGMDEFRYALEEAHALSAPVIRIWAGTKGSATVQADERKELLDNMYEVCLLSEEAGISVALEYHGNTLTDDRRSVRTLLSETGSWKARPVFYWQPRWDWTEEERLNALADIDGRLSHMHVFTWRHEDGHIFRHPLSDGESMWRRALDYSPQGYALLEFVDNDSDGAFLRDAETLNQWLSEGEDRE